MLRRAFNPLLRTLRYQWLCSRSGFSSLSQFRFELSHEVMLKRKNLTKLVAIKTCRCYLFQMTCSADRPSLFTSNCSMQSIRIFLSGSRTHLSKVSITLLQLLPLLRHLTYLSQVWILLSVVVQLVVMAIFSGSTPVQLCSELSHKVMLNRKNLAKLVAIKTCQPCLFQMTCSANRP